MSASALFLTAGLFWVAYVAKVSDSASVAAPPEIF